ncbi:hypothetical protein M9H77_21112 [Catharanthus roseus]|uniref:Uncharacterized protein n=1 Tax=Catharanthus roseus TaxID=4058 RepID=A0ACC0AMI0_CATRO|nr:hypothetical protein M9H77_21112 [Catharanthus roseus]
MANHLNSRFSNSRTAGRFRQQSTRNHSNFGPRIQQSQSHRHNYHHLNYGVIGDTPPVQLIPHHHHYNAAAVYGLSLLQQQQNPYTTGNYIPRLINQEENRVFSWEEDWDDQIPVPVPNRNLYTSSLNQIDGRICLNDQTMSRIPWQYERRIPRPAPATRDTEETSNWQSMVDDDVEILEAFDELIRDSFDHDQIERNDGFSEESVSDHLEIRTTHGKEEEICVVCQCEYEENEKLGRLGCGHEYHSDCIRRWLLQRKFCPICKRIA